MKSPETAHNAAPKYLPIAPERLGVPVQGDPSLLGSIQTVKRVEQEESIATVPPLSEIRGGGQDLVVDSFINDQQSVAPLLNFDVIASSAIRDRSAAPAAHACPRATSRAIVAALKYAVTGAMIPLRAMALNTSCRSRTATMSPASAIARSVRATLWTLPPTWPAIVVAVHGGGPISR
ncbi:hypothetical protein [Burkholderia gladioli]|uniref:hypothetical protein n=1 Tax=Burkholderia gladioli TaxID=28095 RepID=UPI00163E36F1|nr:hypothetical protein [Burkholderia gladioli]